ncbi:MAG: hypothetical protein IJS53_00940, partial [Clostridia bacterium]|nr:hypothetical protein [Clostridia bacterium]
MKEFNWTVPLRRVGAFALALLLALSPLAALAAEILPPLVFTLEWGEGQQAISAEVTEPGYEGSYWLYVPQDARMMDAVLLVSDTYNQYSQITLEDGRLLNGLKLSELGYVDAGTELGLDYLVLLAYAPGSITGEEVRLYVSTETDTPTVPQPVEIETQVPVCYYDSMTGQLVQQTFVTVRTGDNWVTADDSLMPGYERISDSRAYVLVDSNGGCQPAQVEFHYQKQAQPVDVTVRLVDETGSEFSRFTRSCAPGTTTISADYVDGYDINYNNATSYDIYVDANGANMTEVTFYYTRKVNAVTVTVNCVDETGNVFSSYTQECGAGSTTIAAQGFDGYDINYNHATSYDIYVDANGANMTEVTF